MPKGELICEGCGQYESECKCPKETVRVKMRSGKELVLPEKFLHKAIEEKKDGN